MITDRRLLFVGCVPLLASMKVPTEEHAGALSPDPDPLQSLVPDCSTPHRLHDENDASCAAAEPMVSSPQTRILTPTRATSGFSRKESEALTKLLLAIVGAELSQCVLGIVWDSGFSGSVIVDRLSLLPNMKQVVKVTRGGEVGGLLWQAGQCRGYLLLLRDPSPLMQLADHAPHYTWDYAGRFVVAGLNTAQIEAFIRTRKGRKTEHILGIVQDTGGRFSVLTNLLYKKAHMTRAFTWRPPASSRERSSAADGNGKKNVTMTRGMLTLNNSVSLFPDKTRDLQGATLNVVHFLFPPVVMFRHGANGSVVERYGGNIRLVKAVSGMLNFNAHFIEPSPGELWGELTPNGSWSGMVGLFARGEGDIGVANLFITALGGRREFQEYTAPYGQESTCFLIKRGGSLPQWQSLALPFSRETWLAVLVVALLAGPLLYVLSRPLVTRGERLAGRSFAFSSLYTFAIHLRNSRPLLPVRPSLQVFVIFFWVYVFIVTEAFSANLTAFLTVERVPETINTLKELSKSSLPIYGQGPFFGNNLRAAKNEYARGLADRFIPLPELDAILQHIVRGEGVFIASVNNLIYAMSLHASPRGSPTMRMIKECFQPFNVGMGLQSHSPLKKHLDRAVRRVVEAGLGHHWLQETLMIAKQDRREIRERSSSGAAEDQEAAQEQQGERSVSFSLEHLQGVFIVLGIGCGASLLVFITELLCRDYVRHQPAKPNS